MKAGFYLFKGHILSEFVQIIYIPTAKKFLRREGIWILLLKIIMKPIMQQK